VGRIVAIGGGEIGRPGYAIETLEIDLELKQLSGKSNPNLCFIPTASNDSETYIKAVQNHFGKNLECDISTIELFSQDYSLRDLEEKIFSSDIIYVGGGNTKLMLEKWKETGVEKLLTTAYRDSEIVLSGLSAGAICWFKYGVSDTDKFENPNAELISLSGLNFLDLTLCPHFDVEEDRRPYLKNLLRKTLNTGIGLDNCCAMKIEGDQYEIITSKENSYAWLSKWIDGKYFEWKLKSGSLGNIDELIAAPNNVR